MRYRRFWVAAGWLIVATIVWLSLTPDPGIEYGDKLGHLLAYGTLMFWFCQLHATRHARFAYAIGFVAMGIGLEFVQGALGDRHYDEFDMLANTAGVAAGWIAALAIGPGVFERIERIAG